MYRLTEKLKGELRKPLEGIISEENLKHLKNPIISVGDKVTLSLDKYNIIPDVSIVDYKTRRGEVSKEEKEKIKNIGDTAVTLENEPGTISDSLWHSIDYSIWSSSKVRIDVIGEEDLAALPAIYLAENGTKVIYGIPDKGIALVTSNEKNKRAVSKVFDKMLEE